MPPKKAAAEKKVLLGRPGNNLKAHLPFATVVNVSSPA
jgi:hypothetical protein